MKLFQLNNEGEYTFETTGAGNDIHTVWEARLGVIANLKNSIEEEVFVKPNTDLEDELIIASAEALMQLIHVFGHAGSRFLFTGLLEGTETTRGMRFFDQRRMTEIHVWPQGTMTLIVIYHFPSNMEYRVRVVPNFR